MVKIDIIVYETGGCYCKNITRFREFCHSTLKKREVPFVLTHNGAIIEGDKRTVFNILDELDKRSIPLKVRKRAGARNNYRDRR